MVEKIDSKEKLREYLDCETKIYHGGISRFFPVLVTETQILRKHCILLRKTEYYKNTGHRLLGGLYDLRLRRLQNLYGLHIPPNTCGKGLNIAHTGPIIINDACEIGENLRIHVGTCIGGNDGGAPRLGSNVYIGPGAKLFGGIDIADGCRIGANAVVNKSCPLAGATLVGVPAKVIVKEQESAE